MKLLLLQLAALTTAFVLPNEQVSYLKDVKVEASHLGQQVAEDVEQTFQDASDKIRTSAVRIFDDAEDAFEQVASDAQDKYEKYTSKAKGALNDVFTIVEEGKSDLESHLKNAYSDANDWAGTIREKLNDVDTESILGHHGGHHKPNMTIYQLIAKSKYTTKLAEAINQYPDFVEALNGTAANYTLFAPTDEAFGNLPFKPSKKVLKGILAYHLSADFYPASRILATRTIPSRLYSSSLGKKPLPQRLATNIGFRGLTVNFYSRIVAVNIYGTNGVIHGVNNVILPPPKAMTLVQLDPGDLSSLELGLLKTGLFDLLNTTEHAGGTLFAPTNDAFSRLGHKATAFLFSKYGLKYLKALLEYHVVPDNTLYSDAYYKASNSEATDVPKGTFHVDLPTLLKYKEERKHLSIDIARYGRLIEIKINSFARVAQPDLVAKDGVIHLLDNVLVPPKELANGETEPWNGQSEIEVDDLKERLEPFVGEDIAEEESQRWEEL